MLNEKMGVPDGIEKQGKLVYDKLIDKLNSMDEKKLINDLSKMSYGDNIEINIMLFDLEISDIKREKIIFILKFEKHDIEYKIKTLSASHQVGSKIDSIKGELKLLNKGSRFGIELIFNDKLIESDNIILDIIREIKKFIKPHIITHELKHFYDGEKKKVYQLVLNTHLIKLMDFPK